jgi:hypothetical protein
MRRLTLVFVAGLLAVGLAVAARIAVVRALRLHPTLFLTAADRETLYERLARDLVGIYDAVPDARVGKILQRNVEKTQLGARIVSNNAGMRSSLRYVPKPAGTYRIVCLGDSFVEGSAGAEEDRFCDQMGQILAGLGYRHDGRRVETYALGVGGWTATNAAQYLTSRLSAYDPDIVVALFVGNDITDGQGVTGIGASTNAFSPAQRDLGSGVTSGMLPLRFGVPGYNLLGGDLGPESRRLWEAAFRAWRRLEGLQAERGGRMIFALLRSGPYFDALTREYYRRFGMRSPFVETSALGRRLPHDGHPDREGHRIIASHLLHVMHRRGWLAVAADALPALDPRLSTHAPAAADARDLARLRGEAASGLPYRIDFTSLDAAAVMGLLGGIWPDPAAADPLAAAPYGSLATTFLLRREPRATQLHVRIRTLPFPELYPQRIRLRVDGRWQEDLRLTSRRDAGEHVLSAALPIPDRAAPAVEVHLRTEAYVSTIDDHLMRSYQLLEAWQE